MGISPSFGAAVAWDITGGSNYVAIGQVGDIQGPSITREVNEVIHHGLVGGWREFIAGLADGGEFTFPIVFDNANAEHTTNLLASLDAGSCASLPSWQFTINTCIGTAVWTFSGILTGYNPQANVSGLNAAALSIKVSGKPALTVS